MSRVIFAFKLFRIRKEGSIGSLFVEPTARHPIGTWIPAKAHSHKKLKFRKGWHALIHPNAPHLSKKNRAWYIVMVDNYEVIDRPKNHGGKWVIAQKLNIIGRLPDSVIHLSTGILLARNSHGEYSSFDGKVKFDSREIIINTTAFLYVR